MYDSAPAGWILHKHLKAANIASRWSSRLWSLRCVNCMYYSVITIVAKKIASELFLLFLLLCFSNTSVASAIEVIDICSFASCVCVCMCVFCCELQHVNLSVVTTVFCVRLCIHCGVFPWLRCSLVSCDCGCVSMICLSACVVVFECGLCVSL